MNADTLRAYRRFRATGDQAIYALRSARTVVRFSDLGEDRVRITCEPEEENYFDVYGYEDKLSDQKEMEDTLERMGCYCVRSEYFDGLRWRRADSVGMCVYEDPADPFENCYVVDLMQAAIDALPDHENTPILVIGDCEVGL